MINFRIIYVSTICKLVVLHEYDVFFSIEQSAFSAQVFGYIH